MVERLRSFRGIRGVFRTHSNILGAASNKDNPRAHAVINLIINETVWKPKQSKIHHSGNNCDIDAFYVSVPSKSLSKHSDLERPTNQIAAALIWKWNWFIW